jgi:hypothetical protein
MNKQSQQTPNAKSLQSQNDFLESKSSLESSNFSKMALEKILNRYSEFPLSNQN